MIIFGQMIAAFGDTSSSETILQRVNKVSLRFVYLGVGAGIVSFLRKLFKTIMRKPEIDSDDAVGIVLEDIKGDVELKDVYFSYPSRPEQLIFDGLSLQVSSGKTEALVGESGSGKSTVINLVERFYDPQAGEVCIDGINIKSFRLGWIRQKIGLVSQEPLLFTTSIKDNISHGREDATLEEIKEAAELASAATFIEKLPNGYDSTVGQHGTQLSGGQKQRIAIARAILKNPRILLLDEATSALDLESERIVQNALNRIMKNRTTLIVAHRLSTVTNADSISVVHQGKIIEQGHHDELVKDPQGAYSQLIRLQEAHQDDDHHVDAGITHSRSTRSLPLQQSTCNPAGTVSQQTALIPSSTASNKSTKHNGTNSEKKNENSDGKNLKKTSFGRLLTLSKKETGALGGRLCIDALNLRRLVGDNLAVIIQCTASLISGIAIAMISDWKLSLVIMFIIPLIGLQGYAQVKFLKGFSQDAKMMYEEASQVAVDAVVSIKTIASFCAQKRVVTIYNNKCQASRIQGIRTGIVGGLGFGFSNLMVYTSSALCYFVGAQFISHGKSTFSSVFKVIGMHQ
ncbi:hypothetical protein PR202_gb02005 [Eleusine coracana subsp. coracana]|uniref:Uncharacterized protein n=1 Tax=Eleusine coracana subsp. coracana TaxID=191504 RepID=A0AAV5DWM5_ELECO|nr:hypothetical protein PR202_gb02005 [Eleusine coracana subsp. coracana]